jgi:hypothetical protein
LDEEMRAVLLAILRGDLRFGKGNRRTFAQMQRDRDAALDITLAIIAGLSPAQAREAWLDANPNVSAETLKGMLRRAARERIGRREAGGWVKMLKSVFEAPDQS